MNPRPAAAAADSIPYRSAALPAYYLGRSAAIWLASVYPRSVASHRDDPSGAKSTR